jgi:phage N-6-adenine-methyltransferase
MAGAKRRWSTQQSIFDALDSEFHFAVDLCADEDNFKVARYMNAAHSLNLDWGGDGVGWLNPPYGAAITPWMHKACFAKRRIVALVPTRTNPPWWHQYAMNATEIRFIERKLSFDEPNGHRGVPFTGHAIVLFGFPMQKSQVGPRCVSWRQPAKAKLPDTSSDCRLPRRG